MQILTSGSFVNLENREKIEQLIFTAKELANAATQSEGFVNDPAGNTKLAGEMWKGAEYICRGHEEATIKNIFLINFLDRLRETARLPNKPVPIGDRPAISHAAETSETAETAETAEIANGKNSDDEFLGIIPSSEVEDNGHVSRSYADECIPEGERELGEREKFYEPPNEIEVERGFEKGNEVNAASIEAVESSLVRPSQPPTDPIETSQIEEAIVDVEQTNQLPDSEAQAVRPIVIAEKEPYQFENCTVTTVIQLLPEASGFRKCIVSIRTHDFPPQIIVATLSNGSILEEMPAVIGSAFDRYRTQLPVMAADQLKKEKAAGKKRVQKPATTSKGKTSIPKVSEKETNPSPPEAAAGDAVHVPVSEPSDEQVSLFRG